MFLTRGYDSSHDDLAMKKTSTSEHGTSETLTKVQLDVLRCIQSYISVNKFSPSYDEIAKELKTTIRNVRRILTILTRKGMVSKTPGKVRSLIVTDYGRLVAKKRTSTD
jgi:Mn-dependent DtxR family transcriptional regulator